MMETTFFFAEIRFPTHSSYHRPPTKLVNWSVNASHPKKEVGSLHPNKGAPTYSSTGCHGQQDGDIHCRGSFGGTSGGVKSQHLANPSTCIFVHCWCSVNWSKPIIYFIVGVKTINQRHWYQHRSCGESHPRRKNRGSYHTQKLSFLTGPVPTFVPTSLWTPSTVDMTAFQQSRCLQGRMPQTITS